MLPFSAQIARSLRPRPHHVAFHALPIVVAVHMSESLLSTRDTETCRKFGKHDKALLQARTSFPKRMIAILVFVRFILSQP
jgi:hypothetical protein